MRAPLVARELGDVMGGLDGLAAVIAAHVLRDLGVTVEDAQRVLLGDEG